MSRKGDSHWIRLPLSYVGYLRLTLILLTWLLFEKVYWFLPLYTLQMCLDGKEGEKKREINFERERERVGEV